VLAITPLNFYSVTIMLLEKPCISLPSFIHTHTYLSHRTAKLRLYVRMRVSFKPTVVLLLAGLFFLALCVVLSLDIIYSNVSITNIQFKNSTTQSLKVYPTMG